MAAPQRRRKCLASRRGLRAPSWPADGSQGEVAAAGRDARAASCLVLCETEFRDAVHRFSVRVRCLKTRSLLRNVPVLDEITYRILYHPPKRIGLKFLVRVAHIRRSLSHETAPVRGPARASNLRLVRRQRQRRPPRVQPVNTAALPAAPVHGTCGPYP